MVSPPMLTSVAPTLLRVQQVAHTSLEEAEEAQLAQELGSDRCGQADEWLSASCRADGERSRVVLAARAE